MLYEIMREVRNFFAAPNGYREGTFTISGGAISLPFLVSGEYFLVEGSALNDGVHSYPAADLRDETFTGVITELRPPADFLQLVSEIEEYQTKSGTAAPYQSESFGGYSYTKATNKNGDAAGWRDVFRSRLNVWRKV